MNTGRFSSTVYILFLFITSVSYAQWPRFHHNSCNTGVYPGAEGKSGVLVELWNYPIKWAYTTSPALADLDNDGQLEILFGSQADTMYAFNGEDGSILWTYSTGISFTQLQSPVVTDIDGDQKPDVVFSTIDSLIALHGDSGDLLWSTPVTSTNGQIPCIADLDGDGTCEVVFSGTDETTAFDGETGAVIWEADGYFATVLGPTVAEDTDLDGAAEVMVCTADPDTAFCLLNGTDGSLIWSTPLIVTNFFLTPAPAFADIDLDGFPEIVICSGDNNLTVLNPLDGSVKWSTILPGFCYAAPCLFDIDGNDSLEIVVAAINPNRLRAYSCTGDLIWTSLVSGFPYSTPAIADIDGDQIPEIVQTSSTQYTSYLQVINAETGTEDYKFSYSGAIIGSPAIGDVDGDGFYDVVFDINSNYLCVMSTSTEGIQPETGNGQINLTISPNPMRSSSSISITLAEPGYTSVEIFDLEGRVLTSLENSELAAGEHTYNWNGMSNSTEAVPAGVYLCRIQSGEFSETATFCILR